MRKLRLGAARNHRLELIGDDVYLVWDHRRYYDGVPLDDVRTVRRRSTPDAALAWAERHGIDTSDAGLLEPGLIALLRPGYFQ